VQAEATGGVRINMKILNLFKNTGRKTGFHRGTYNVRTTLTDKDRLKEGELNTQKNQT